MKKKALAALLGFSLLTGVFLAPISADAATPRKGQFCAKAKLGTHSAALTCKKVGSYNRWE